MADSFMSGNEWGVAGGISSVSSILGAFASDRAGKIQSKNALYTIDQEKNDYIRRLENTYEKENAIVEQTRSMLSERGLQAMVSENRVRANISSTGVSGTSMNEIANQSNYDQLFDSTVLIARSRAEKTNLTRERLSNYINFKRGTEQVARGMDKGTGLAGALTSGLQAGLNTFIMGKALGGKLDTSSGGNSGKSIS